MPNQILQKKANKKVALKQYQIDWIRRIAKQMNETEETLFESHTSSQIMQFVESQTQKSLSWQENVSYSFSTYYKINGTEDEHNEWYELATKYTKLIQKKEKKNLQSEKEKENYLTQTELIAIRDAHKEYKTEDGMQGYLLLCFLTMQPPLRTGVYTTMKYVKTEEELQSNDVDNLIHINRCGEWSGIMKINNDKVSGTFAHKDNNIIEVQSPKLLKIIDKTLKEYPRQNIFDFPNTSKPGDRLLVILRKLTKNKFDIDMARSSYINYMIETHNLESEEQKETFAEQMRHSVCKQQKNYRKILQKDTEDDIIDYKQQIKELEMKLQEKEDEMNKYKQYWEKKRYDMVYTANRQNTKIKQLNIDEFDIKWDEIEKKYY